MPGVEVDAMEAMEDARDGVGDGVASSLSPPTAA